MKPGSVIVDLAVEQGGNCPLTELDKSSSSTACTSSALEPAGAGGRRRERPVRAQSAEFLDLMVDPTDRRAQDRPRGRDHRGDARVHRRRGQPQAARRHSHDRSLDPTVVNLTVFVLAVFVGYHVVWNVTPALHTPLMSVTNAISSVIVVGAILAAGSGTARFGPILGAVAVGLAAINTFGGFLVSQRMLEMFKKKDRRRSASRRDVGEPQSRSATSSPASSSSWRSRVCRTR